VSVNVILRRVRVIVVAVEKQEVLHIPSVAVALVIQSEIHRIILSSVASLGLTIFFHGSS